MTKGRTVTLGAAKPALSAAEGGLTPRERVTKRRRLDLLLVERGLAESRGKAQAAIMAGDVLVDGETVVRHAASVAEDARIELAPAARYVGRGGEKLEHALDAFALDVTGLVCMDVGASTGGFTDCLLQRDAARVYAIDVGYGQLDYRLRNDARVTVLERTNIRKLTELPAPAGKAGKAPAPALATVDVAFIGLENVLPSVMRLLAPEGRILALVKPQFQARRSEVEEGGVVKSPLVHASVLGRVVAWGATHGLRFGGLTASPLRGPAGNKEFFVLWTTPDS